MKIKATITKVQLVDMLASSIAASLTVIKGNGPGAVIPGPALEDISRTMARNAATSLWMLLEQMQRQERESAFEGMACDGDHASPLCNDPECWRKGEDDA